MQIRNEKDFWSGLMFASIGVFSIVFAQENELGTSARMGPAYFPTLLGIFLVVVGLYIALLAFLRPSETGTGKVDSFHWQILGWVLGAVILFGLLLMPLGLLGSLAVMIVVSLLAEKKLFLKETLCLILVLDFIAWAAFVYGIGMIVPVWPSFL